MGGGERRGSLGGKGIEWGGKESGRVIKDGG